MKLYNFWKNYLKREPAKTILVEEIYFAGNDILKKTLFNGLASSMPTTIADFEIVSIYHNKGKLIAQVISGKEDAKNVNKRQ